MAKHRRETELGVPEPTLMSRCIAPRRFVRAAGVVAVAVGSMKVFEI